MSVYITQFSSSPFPSVKYSINATVRARLQIKKHTFTYTHKNIYYSSTFFLLFFFTNSPPSFFKIFDALFVETLCNLFKVGRVVFFDRQYRIFFDI